jgi:hypothetical protein
MTTDPYRSPVKHSSDCRRDPISRAASTICLNRIIFVPPRLRDTRWATRAFDRPTDCNSR